MTALAWQWAKGVSSPIIGGTKAAYLEDAAKAFAVTLTDDDIAYLDIISFPVPLSSGTVLFHS